jgi:hypothetical protein
MMGLDSNHIDIVSGMAIIFAFWTCARMSIFYEDHFEKKK